MNHIIHNEEYSPRKSEVTNDEIARVTPAPESATPTHQVGVTYHARNYPFSHSIVSPAQYPVRPHKDVVEDMLSWGVPYTLRSPSDSYRVFQWSDSDL